MVDSRYLLEMFSRVCEILQGEHILNVVANKYRIQGCNKVDPVIEQKLYTMITYTPMDRLYDV